MYFILYYSKIKRIILMRLRLLSVCAYFFLIPIGVSAEKLTITSTPPGATVEINGIVAGTTPFEKDYPGSYFHRTHTSPGSRLEQCERSNDRTSSFLPGRALCRPTGNHGSFHRQSRRRVLCFTKSRSSHAHPAAATGRYRYDRHHFRSRRCRDLRR